MRHTALDIAWESVYDASELQIIFAMNECARLVSKPLSPRILTPVILTPRRAAPLLMPHCPARRRAPTGPTQQTLFVVLDRMGARHRAVSGGSALKRALEDAGRDRL